MDSYPALSEAGPLSFDQIVTIAAASFVGFSVVRIALPYVLKAIPGLLGPCDDVTSLSNKIVGSMHVILTCIPGTTALLKIIDAEVLDMDMDPVCEPYVFVMGSISCGFFLFDLFVLLLCPSAQARKPRQRAEFVVHHIAALIGGAIGMAYNRGACLGAACLTLLEGPTLVLNNIFILKAIGRKGSMLYIANGAVVVLVYFLLRVLGMGYVAYRIFIHISEEKKPVLEDPGLYCAGFVVLVLYGLSLFWFPKVALGFWKEVRPYVLGGGTAAAPVGTRARKSQSKKAS